MATRLQPSDCLNAGCKHGVETSAKTAIRNYIATIPPNRTQTVDVQLRNALQTATGFAWTSAMMLKALCTFAEDE